MLKKCSLNFTFLGRRRQCPKNANPFEVLASNAEKCDPFTNCHQTCEPFACSRWVLRKSANPAQGIAVRPCKTANPYGAQPEPTNPRKNAGKKSEPFSVQRKP